MLDVNKNTAWAMSTKLKKAFGEYSGLLAEMVEYGNELINKRLRV